MNLTKFSKKHTALWAALFVIGQLSTAACTGPAGPPGPQGQAGEDGQDGQDGEDGEDGEDGTNPDGPDLPDGPRNENCVPTALLELDDIPNNPSLQDDNDDTVAIFEVDGHNLIGKHVDDAEAAAGGLRLWQELTTRIPANQLADLVQFEISLDEDPVAYFNRTGDVTTERDGLKLGFSVRNFELNDPDPCAPLQPRRGTFDWSLVHEFGHLRGWVDGSWPLFLNTFPNVLGSGEGYPEDGSPILTGDFVTSYAERADGDEDYAENWTTFVMLADDAIPAATEGEDLVLTKLRWMSEQPGLRALRNAIRLTEAGVVPGTVEPAPRLADQPDYSAQITSPLWMHGVFEEEAGEGRQFEFKDDDIILSILEGGAAVERLSLKETREGEGLFYFENHGGQPALAFSYIVNDGELRYNIDFFRIEDDDDDTLEFRFETYDPATNELLYNDPIIVTRVP